MRDTSTNPVVLVEVAGRTWKATIDTGFNGDFELPESLAVDVNPRYHGTAKSLLAGNQVIKEEYFSVDVPFDGRLIRGPATFVPGDGILIGTNVFRDYRLTVDFPSGEVTIESRV